MILRNARAEEANTAYQYIEDTRAYHSSLGFVQWHPGYPTLATIEGDIEAGISYIFADGNKIYGNSCIIM